MLLKSGVIEAGPWFVLADELIPGGEALVRNLFAGRRTLRLLRALDESPRVLYCPDSFGHPAALPTLARGFGFGMVMCLARVRQRALAAGRIRAAGPHPEASRWCCIISRGAATSSARTCRWRR